MRVTILISGIITALVLLATACGRSNNNTGLDKDLQRGASELSLNIITDPAVVGSTAQAYDLSTESADGELLVHINATGAANLKALYFELTYDARHLSPLTVDAAPAMGAKSDLVCLEVFQEPGKVTYGQVLTNWESRTGFTGSATIASVRFKQLPAPVVRAVSAAPDDALSQSTLAWDAGTNTLSWYYRNTGDYNQNSQVGIDDLTPLGAHWNETATPPPFAEAGVQSVIDGNANGQLNIGDLTPIGINWHKRAIGGYNVYASTSLADYPTPPTAANGTSANLLGNVAFSAATGTSIERKRFAYVVTAPAGVDYYWVRPNDSLGGLGQDGIASTIADGTPPVVSSTVPANGAQGVALNIRPEAIFSQAMDPATISAATFTLMQGSTPVPGSVTYSGVTAVFRPDGMLHADSLYTATITSGAENLAGVPLVSDYVWTFQTGASPDITAPMVTSTVPHNGAQGTAINVQPSATFSEAMDPQTLNPTTFTLGRGQGTSLDPVTGIVTCVGVTAVFTPTANLLPDTTYTATITTGATDLAGNALVADYSWTFTTGALQDTEPPMVIATVPADGAGNVPINIAVAATFSEAMDPLTITAATFTLMDGLTPVLGNVTYSGVTAIFSPLIELDPDTIYSATITAGANDLAGNALEDNYSWTFTTTIVDLGAIAPFGSFGGGAGMTNTGIFTVVNGDIGTTGASTMITGFHDENGTVYSETPLNIGQVNGLIYTAPPFPGTAELFAIATEAALDAQIAYNNLSPASMPGGIDPGAGQLGGLTLAPGIYQAAGGTFQITNLDLTLDGQGDPNAFWVFQTASSLTVGDTAPRSVILINGAQARNVYWYVGSAATINGAGGGTMVGTIIASAGVTFSTAGNVVLTVLDGRAIGLNASVTMVNTIINIPQ